MLVLSRKVGQRILIGDQIAVTIVRVGQGGVRIGIEAPADLAVVREELVGKKENQPRTSAAGAAKTANEKSLTASRSLNASNGDQKSSSQPSPSQASSPTKSNDSGDAPRVLPR